MAQMFSDFFSMKTNTETQIKNCEAQLLHCSSKLDDKEKWEKYFQGFLKLFRSYLTHSPLSWSEIQPPLPEKIKKYSDLPTFLPEIAPKLLKQLVVVKLNGGLGTTMGCSFPKSLISVKNDLTFLDITVMQLEHLNNKYDSDVPLVLMNSFSTDEDTSKVLTKYDNLRTKIFTFKQSQYPRISGDTLMPLCLSSNSSDSNQWYPPGHGNFYEEFYQSGLLEKFLNQGRKYAFVSNSDNLGASVDLSILNFISTSYTSQSPVDFIMEVTDKTRADIKGGTLIMYENKLRILEMAQVPSIHIEDFKAVNKFRVFNTNNIWMDLEKVLDKVKNGKIEMDHIANKKTLSNGTSVIQLETAIGSAIMSFEGSIGINVPRSRFLPVKSNSDLLLIMSNLYSMNEGNIVMNPRRLFQTTPLIQLSGPAFKSVKEFLARFPTIPDILELDYLSVSGDVTFGRDVVLKGTVIILAPHDQHIDIPSGSILENKIISGNLRIIDH